MGLLWGTAKILKELVTKHSSNLSQKKVCTLGHQRVLLSPSQYTELIGRKVAAEDLEYHLRWKTNFIKPSVFFRDISYEQLDEIDISSYENCSIKFDLNSTDLPNNLLERFDLVIDGSTLEHVFDTSSAMFNCTKMLKIGGLIVHISPCNNMADDGFYQFSPSFYEDYYSANGFKICERFFHGFSISKQITDSGVEFSTSDNFVSYCPPTPSGSITSDSILSALPTGSIDSLLPLQYILVAKKVETIFPLRKPLQSRYTAKKYWMDSL